MKKLMLTLSLAFVFMSFTNANEKVENSLNVESTFVEDFGRCHIVITDSNGNVVYDETWPASNASTCKAILEWVLDGMNQ